MWRLRLRPVLVLSVLAVTVAVGANPEPSLAVGTYAISSSAGCQALLDEPDVDGYISGNECIVSSSTGISGSLSISAGWTLTLRPSSALTISATTDVFGAGTLRIEGPVTNSGQLWVAQGTVVITAPFANTNIVLMNQATAVVQADVINSGTWDNLASTLSIDGATFTNSASASFNNVIGGSVTVIEAPVCGNFFNLGAFGNIPVVDACTPKVVVEQAVGQADPTPAGPVLFTVTWGEDVNGFDLSCVQLVFTGTLTGSADSITGGQREYEVSVSVAGEGTVALTVVAECLADVANNLNAGSTSVDNVVAVALPAPALPDPEITSAGGGSAVAWPAMLALVAGGARCSRVADVP